MFSFMHIYYNLDETTKAMVEGQKYGWKLISAGHYENDVYFLLWRF